MYSSVGVVPVEADKSTVDDGSIVDPNGESVCDEGQVLEDMEVVDDVQLDEGGEEQSVSASR